MSFRAETRRAIAEVQTRGEIPEASAARIRAAYRLRGDAKTRFWREAEAHVSALYVRSTSPATRQRRIDWARIRQWLRDHAVQIVQIFLALLPLFL